MEEQTHKVNLYVPDTLGSSKNGWHKYRTYTKSEEDWIGACIYMHKHGDPGGKGLFKHKGCPFVNKFKCIGCTESGTSRQKKEGKKYSNTAYDTTLKAGLKAAKTAPKWLIIHNSGGREFKGGMANKSIIQLGGALDNNTTASGLNALHQEQYNFFLVPDAVAGAGTKRGRSNTALCPVAPPLKF